MTEMQLLEQISVTSECPRCRAPVIETVDTANRRKRVNPTPVAGGLYELDSRGKVARRPLRVIADEFRVRAATHGGGYAVHTCGLPSRWDE